MEQAGAVVDRLRQLRGGILEKDLVQVCVALCRNRVETGQHLAIGRSVAKQSFTMVPMLWST